MDSPTKDFCVKVPEVTFLFWVAKVAATTLGETAGDAVSMTLQLGYLIGSAIFASFFIASVALQVRSQRFSAALYWMTIIASTTVGTTLADYADRSLGIGYEGGTSLLVCLLLLSLFLWHRTLGSISVASVRTKKAELFYWVTIMFSQTLGTALGDWTADSLAFGYLGAAAIFGIALALLAAAYFLTRISRTVLFWAAFVLTRPLGAAVGDFLDKPVAAGGLALGRFAASGALLAVVVGCLLFSRQKAAASSH